MIFCDSNIIIGRCIEWDYLYDNANLIFEKNGLVYSKFVFNESYNKINIIIESYLTLLTFFKRKIIKYDKDIFNQKILHNIIFSIDLDEINLEYDFNENILSFDDLKYFENFFFKYKVESDYVARFELCDIIDKMINNIRDRIFENFNYCSNKLLCADDYIDNSFDKTKHSLFMELDKLNGYNIIKKRHESLHSSDIKILLDAHLFGKISDEILIFATADLGILFFEDEISKLTSISSFINANSFS